MSAPADPLAWPPGQRLVVRARRWTLAAVEAAPDCAAITLEEDGAPAVARTLLSPFDRFVPEPANHAPRAIRLRRWTRVARTLAAGCRPAGSLRPAPSSRIRLLAYQLEPALAVARIGATRILIADGVGLGKTIQAGLIAAELMAESSSARVLVLVPAGLRDQWRRELLRLFGLPAVAADSAWLRAAASERPADSNPWTLPGLYVTSQDFVKQPEVLRPLEDVTWDLLVLDEAHAASARSDRRAAADALARRSRRVVLLTATPPFHDAAEYEALCGIGRIDSQEGPILMFRRSTRDVGCGQARRSRLLAVRPSVAETRMHQLLDEYTRRVWRESNARGDPRSRLAAIVLRKRALSSAASLLASVQRRVALLVDSSLPPGEQLPLPLVDEEPLDDDVPREALAAPGLADAGRERRWLALIAEAAQHAARHETKKRFLERLLDRIREPAIVFTEYRDTLAGLRQSLADCGHQLLILHGGMRPAERSGVQHAFNDSPAVLLATDAAAEGLNLHARCRVIVHYELPWSLTRLEQRAGRVDRLGQQRRVHEVALVASATAERLVLAPLLRRAAHARTTDTASLLPPVILTELQAAQRIIGGRPADPVERSERIRAAPLVKLTVAMDLRALADAEARRLALIRTWSAAEAERAPRNFQRPVVSTIARRSSGLPPGLIVIYFLSLTGPARHSVHDVPLVLSLPTPTPSSPPSAREVRAIVQPFAHASHPVVRALLTASVQDALDLAFPIYRQVEDARAARERLMRQARRSAARQLVQAGLFDRRWRADAAAGQRPVVLPDDERIGWTASRVLGVELRLAGALLVRR